MAVNFNDSPIGTPEMVNDAQHHSHLTLRNKEAIKHQGDFSNQPKPPKPKLRNEEAIRNMGDPSKPGPSADESKKGAKRARARKALAKPAKAASKKGARARRPAVIAADQTKGAGRVVAADTPVGTAPSAS